MAHGPIQVVLNTDDYIAPEVKNRGGKPTDFYQGANDRFAAHKEFIKQNMSEIGILLNSNPYSTVGFAKVRLIKEALAKSHRPGIKLFTENQHCRIVGGMRRGEMIVAIDGEKIGTLLQTLDGAEIEVRKRKNDKGEFVPTPSRLRTEVGAIERIDMISADEKCTVSVAETVDWVQGRKGCLYVELFVMPPSSMDDLPAPAIVLFSTLRAELEKIDGLRVGKVPVEGSNTLAMTIVKGAPNHVSYTELLRQNQLEEPCGDLNIYERLLSILRIHPLVKSISLSPSMQDLVPSFRFDEKEDAIIPSPEHDNYPIIGIIDNGISSIYSKWVLHTWDNIAPIDRDMNHGTFISGLLIQGKTLNANICQENDGCFLLDVCMLPKRERMLAYYPNMDVFLQVFDDAVRDAVTHAQVRVFNMSLNTEIANRLKEHYSDWAKKIDELSKELDVIFVVSAGNLKSVPFRAPWNDEPSINIAEIRSRKNDIAVSPAESLCNVSVGALNPDKMGLAMYSRKGVASDVAVKPDFVYPSGSGMCVVGIGEGLYSVHANGKITTASGTSFSAPLVAKTLAALEHSIVGRVPRETLLALLYHNSYMPEAFANPAYKQLLEEIIGYGMPKSSSEILNGDDHSITLVFSGKIKKGMILSFPFTWPRSLIRDGKCRGYVKLTLVSSPAIDYNFGSECVRENVGVYVRKITAKGTKVGIMEPLYKDSSSSCDEPGYEWRLIEEDHKWHSVKVFEKNIMRMQNPGQFYMEVDYMSRTMVEYSVDGVPFTVLLTISDNKGEAPVYEEMRNSIIANGAHISDIRTAARISSRV